MWWWSVAGPSGATAAHELAKQGHSVLLLDRGGRIKPCGGAIPPRLIQDFEIPDALLVAKARCARMIAPSSKHVDIPIDNGFVGMVNREAFDEWLRERAEHAGAVRRTGNFEHLSRDSDGVSVVHYAVREGRRGSESAPAQVRARTIIGADGARSGVARQGGVPGAERTRYVFAYHEIVRAPEGALRPAGYDGARCDVYYQGRFSPDFYGWVFPHGDTLSVGTGSADKGFSLKGSVQRMRETSGLAGAETLRREGAPIPMKPLPRWDNGRDLVLAGDAAGVVAPASGEGIYYAMVGGQLAAEAVHALLATGDVKSLRAGAQALHEAARPGVLGAGHPAVVLVQQRKAARAFRQDLRGPRRAAAHLRLLHEQAPDAQEADGARAHLLQGPEPPARSGAGVVAMTTMQELWSSGRWVDLALAIVLAEVLLMAWLVQVTGRHTWFRAYLLNLGSGLCLIFALRSSLADSGWDHARLVAGALRRAAWRRPLVEVAPAGRPGSGTAKLGLDQPFLAQAEHQPLAATCLPGKMPQGPDASPALPVYSAQLLHSWVAACLGYFLASTLVVSAA